jgi:DNA-binding IclR family transcriptional regulator
MATEDSTTLQSSEKAFDILDQLVKTGAAGVTDLATQTSYHKSTVYVHLRTLEQLGLVVKSGTTYRPSLKFIEYGANVKQSTDVYTQSHDEIETVAQETGELAILGVPENGDIVVVHAVSGAKAIQELTAGTRLPMETSAMGQAILAHREEDVEGAAADGGPVDTSSGRHDGTDLESVRYDGYAVTDEDPSVDGPSAAAPVAGESRAESRRVGLDVRAIAAPVVHDGDPVGAVGVTGPAKRIAGGYQTDIRDRVRNAAELIETRLKYQ